MSKIRLNSFNRQMNYVHIAAEYKAGQQGKNYRQSQNTQQYIRDMGIFICPFGKHDNGIAYVIGYKR
jgi:hypothetical protein